jgi:DNA-binding PadR family transcriptional regulator
MSAGYHRAIDDLGGRRFGMRRGHHHSEESRGRRRGPFGPPDTRSFRAGMPFFGRGRTARRGEVRAAIVALLAEQPMHGYQIITELAERSGGEWRPSAGSIYPTLQQLADEGLVRDREVDGRRVYELTETGREAVERTRAQTPPWERPGRDDMLDLRHAARGVMSATMQIARDGDSAMHLEARRILTDARRSLYRLLAEDGIEVEGGRPDDTGD